MNGKPLDFYVGGYFSGNKIYTQTFKVPELFVVESQIREYEEKYHLFSIRNKYGLGKS
jgi:RPA family protein